MLIVEGSVVRDEFRGGLTMRADSAMPIEALRVALANRIRIAVDSDLLRRKHWRGDRFVEQLTRHLGPFRGGNCRVVVDYTTDDASGSLMLGDEWRVEARDELLRQLRNLFGAERVSVGYRRGRMPPETESPTRSRRSG
jgi:DNA polymerase-3 subunit alpha